jgi:hypothetical protein
MSSSSHATHTKARAKRATGGLGGWPPRKVEGIRMIFFLATITKYTQSRVYKFQCSLWKNRREGGGFIGGFAMSSLGYLFCSSVQSIIQFQKSMPYVSGR